MGTSSVIAKSCYQGYQLREVFLTHGREFQPESLTWSYVPNNRVCPHLSFLDEEMEIDGRAHGLRRWRSEEHTAHAQIANSRDVIPFTASPVGPNTFACLNA